MDWVAAWGFAATFLGLYLIAMAFVLALNNRGFSEIGVNGLKAQDINSNAQQDSIEEHEKQLEVLWSIVKTRQDSTDESRNRNPLSSSD